MNDFANIRYQLHIHPDVSGQEEFAHNLVFQTVGKLSPAYLYDHVGGYGVIALWMAKKTDNDLCIAFRADMDALPTGHRCGHDGHTASLLRFADLVAKSDSLPCNVMLVFQPSEEDGTGARRILESGIMQKHGVKAVFGMHNLPGYETGCVVMNRTTFAAASTGVIYRLHGRATHASTPEKGVSPGMAVSEIIRRFAALHNGTDNAALFRQTTLIGCRMGEEAFGTAAADAELMFTLRTFSNASMQNLVQQCESIVKAIALAEGLELETEYRDPFRAVENDTSLVDNLVDIMKRAGKKVVVADKPFRWSEDFAEYQTLFPGVFFGVGSGERQPELHNPDYEFPDELIDIIAECFDLILKNTII